MCFQGQFPSESLDVLFCVAENPKLKKGKENFVGGFLLLFAFVFRDLFQLHLTTSPVALNI